MSTLHHQAAGAPRCGDDPLLWPATLLDVAGLDAPEPMVRILDALDTLPEQGSLHVLIDREPHPLYRVLEHKLFLHRTAPTGDGRYEMLIWQPPRTDRE